MLILRGAGSTILGRDCFAGWRIGGREGILFDECRTGRMLTLPAPPLSALAPNTTGEAAFELTSSLLKLSVLECDMTDLVAVDELSSESIRDTGLMGLAVGCLAITRAEATGLEAGATGTE